MLDRRAFMQSAAGLLVPATGILLPERVLARRRGGSGGSGGGGGSSPTQVQILLQGQTAAGQTVTNADPPYPNQCTLGWKSVSGASSYNIYRNANGAGYSLLTNVSASSATSAYGSYVTNQGTYPVQNACDSAYVDTGATNVVGWPAGPVSGVYYPNTSYTYKVSAIVSGVESALSSDSIIIMYSNGKQIMCEGAFNQTGQYNFADTTCPAASPLGATTNLLWNATATYSLINPYTGYSCTNENLGVNGYNYWNLAVYAQQAGSTLWVSPEIAGDNVIAPTTQLAPYGTITQGQWVTLKVPMSTIYYNTQYGSPAAQQWCFYKITIQVSGGPSTASFWMENWFSVT